MWCIHPNISKDGSGEPVSLDFLKGDLEAFRHRGHADDVKDSIKGYCQIAGITREQLMQKMCKDFLIEKRVFKEPNLGDLYRLWEEWLDTHLDGLCLKALTEDKINLSFLQIWIYIKKLKNKCMRSIR